MGADQLFTSSTRFTIVEFKYKESAIKTEAVKPLRQKLCCLLLKNTKNERIQSLQCHYIGWGENNSITFNNYYSEVCNKSIFNESSLDEAPDTSSRIATESMLDKFLNAKVGADYDDFQTYINFLFDISDTDNKNLEVLIQTPESSTALFINCNSLKMLHDWLQENEPKNSYDFGCEM